MEWIVQYVISLSIGFGLLLGAFIMLFFFGLNQMIEEREKRHKKRITRRLCENCNERLKDLL